MGQIANKQRLKLLVPDWDVPGHVLACTTYRQSSDPENAFAGFNLASHVGDDPDLVELNRKILGEALAFPSLPYWLNQVHSDALIEIDHSLSQEPFKADASMTGSDDLVCAILTADCLPLLVTDNKGQAVAAIHAGWRGLAQGIIKKTIEKFCSRLDIRPAECVVWLGPAISQKHFEVGDDVYVEMCSKIEGAQDAFVLNENTLKKEKKYFCDLYHLARLELHGLGIKSVSGGDQCTYAQETEYYSHRRHSHQAHRHQLKLEKSHNKTGQTLEKNCGRMATLIWLSSVNR